MGKKFPTPESEPFVHPSADNSNRFEVDALIRRHGWEIAARASGVQPVWRRRDGREALQSQVEAELPWDELQEAMLTPGLTRRR